MNPIHSMRNFAHQGRFVSVWWELPGPVFLELRRSAYYDSLQRSCSQLYNRGHVRIGSSQGKCSCTNQHEPKFGNGVPVFPANK